MTEQVEGQDETTDAGQAPGANDAEGSLQDHEAEAEEESAAAMDADVPQPPDASETTEGQPS